MSERGLLKRDPLELFLIARPAVPLPEHWGCGSIRLVHICIPHNRTPCGRGLGEVSYRLSWVSLFLSGCASLVLCIFIISQALKFVKGFLTLFLKVRGRERPHRDLNPVPHWLAEVAFLSPSQLLL